MIIMSISEDTNIKEEPEITEDEDATNPSPPLLPIRPTPTSLFQPFLPRPNEPGQKSLAFSIDNILRPSFGGCQMQPPRPLFSSPFFHSSFMALMAAAAMTPPQAPILPSSSPLASPISTSSSTGSTPVPQACVKKESKPVDLSKSHDNNNITVSDEELPSGIKRDEDCPPGMVRGPNGQLWPAWVFCTRYSDRPSSGE